MDAVVVASGNNVVRGLRYGACSYLAVEARYDRMDDRRKRLFKIVDTKIRRQKRRQRARQWRVPVPVKIRVYFAPTANSSTHGMTRAPLDGGGEFLCQTTYP